MYTNADGLNNKMDELIARVEVEKPSTIIITETRPKNNKKEQTHCLSIPGYELFENDVPKRGVAIYVQEGIMAKKGGPVGEENFEENLWLIITVQDAKLLLGAVYKSPNTSKENEKRMFDQHKNYGI